MKTFQLTSLHILRSKSSILPLELPNLLFCYHYGCRCLDVALCHLAVAFRRCEHSTPTLCGMWAKLIFWPRAQSRSCHKINMAKVSATRGSRHNYKKLLSSSSFGQKGRKQLKMKLDKKKTRMEVGNTLTNLT